MILDRSGIVKHWRPNPLTRWALTAVFCLVAWAPVSAQEQEQNAATSLESFSLIWNRNIFDRTRLQDVDPSVPPPKVDAPPPPKIEQFSLVGTILFQEGAFAFFEGTESRYEGAVRGDETIAGFRVMDIDTECVTLEHEGGLFELAVGEGMSRRGDQDWQRESAPAAGSYGDDPPQQGRADEDRTADTQESGDTSSDLLTRLMERRKQELRQ